MNSRRWLLITSLSVAALVGANFLLSYALDVYGILRDPHQSQRVLGKTSALLLYCGFEKYETAHRTRRRARTRASTWVIGWATEKL